MALLTIIYVTMTGRSSRLATLLAVASVVCIVGLAAPDANAIIRRRTITPEVDTGLPVRTDGRQVSMTGPMACDPGENWEVRATLTEGSARGGGRSEGVCRGDPQEWVVRVTVDDPTARFEPGAASGCAVLRTVKDGAETDRHEWCNDIRLVSAEGGAADDGDGNAVSWVALAVAAVAALVAIAALVRARRGDAGRPEASA